MQQLAKGSGWISGPCSPGRGAEAAQGMWGLCRRTGRRLHTPWPPPYLTYCGSSQWSSTRGHLQPMGWLAMFEDIFGCHNWHPVGGDQGCCFTSIMHTTVPTRKNSSALYVNPALGCELPKVGGYMSAWSTATCYLMILVGATTLHGASRAGWFISLGACVPWSQDLWHVAQRPSSPSEGSSTPSGRTPQALC